MIVLDVYVVLDCQAPSLDKDEGPCLSKVENIKIGVDVNEDEDDKDESYPLLKETEFGGKTVAKALRRQCR